MILTVMDCGSIQMLHMSIMIHIYIHSDTDTNVVGVPMLSYRTSLRVSPSPCQWHENIVQCTPCMLPIYIRVLSSISSI